MSAAGVLGIDTAGPVIGVSFGADERTERITRGAEARLVPWIAELCGELDQIQAIAVAVGPGAFTGLRVGIATAQGLALALGVPLIGASPLRSRAERAGATIALLDARKGRVYAGWRRGGFAPHDVDIDRALDAARAAGEDPLVCVGEGALVYRAQIVAAGGAVVDPADHPAPAQLAAHAAERWRRGEVDGYAPVEPVYVRPPDAVPPRLGVGDR